MVAILPEHIIEWKSIKEGDIPDIVKMFERKVEKIKNYTLKEEIKKVLKNTQERMKKWNMDGAMWAVHSITFRYSLIDGIDDDDRILCDQIYAELTAQCDAFYKKLFPDQFFQVKVTKEMVSGLLDTEKTPH